MKKMTTTFLSKTMKDKKTQEEIQMEELYQQHLKEEIDYQKESDLREFEQEREEME